MSISPKKPGEPAPEGQPDASDEKLASPIVPLLWLVIPLVLVILYGIFSS